MYHKLPSTIHFLFPETYPSKYHTSHVDLNIRGSFDNPQAVLTRVPAYSICVKPREGSLCLS